MILTRSKTLLDAKIIPKVSVTEGKSLTSGEMRIGKCIFLYNTVLSVTFSVTKSVGSLMLLVY